MDIVEFLRARLDEDEAVARAAVIPAHNKPGAYKPHPELAEWFYDGDEVEYVQTPEMLAHKYPDRLYVTMDREGLGPSVEADVANHIARHDPARVLREVEAKRRIVDLHANWPVLVQGQPKYEMQQMDATGFVSFRATQQTAWLTEREYRERFGVEPPAAPMIRALASVYADHPDYDPEWSKG